VEKIAKESQTGNVVEVFQAIEPCARADGSGQRRVNSEYIHTAPPRLLGVLDEKSSRISDSLIDVSPVSESLNLCGSTVSSSKGEANDPNTGELLRDKSASKAETLNLDNAMAPPQCKLQESTQENQMENQNAAEQGLRVCNISLSVSPMRERTEVRSNYDRNSGNSKC